MLINENVRRYAQGCYKGVITGVGTVSSEYNTIGNTNRDLRFWDQGKNNIDGELLL